MKQYEKVYLPRYDGYSNMNISHSVLRRFNAGGTTPLKEGSDLFNHRKVVVMLVDGLGYSHLMNARKEVPSVDRALSKSTYLGQLTTMFPSTTSTVMSSVNSGLTPLQHGVIGFTMYIKELGAVINTLSFTPATERGEGGLEKSGMDPTFLYPQRTIYQTLFEKGVPSRILTPAYLANSVMSRTLYNGGERVKYAQLSDLFVNLRRILTEDQDREEFIFVYWSGVDTVSHKYGPGGEEYKAELNSVFHMLTTELLEKCSGVDASLVITADHGQVNIPEGQFHDLSEYQGLLTSLSSPPVGDSRAVFLYASDPAEMKSQMETVFGETSVVIDSSEALDKGFFGSDGRRPGFESRIGDQIVLPYKDHSYAYRYPTYDYSPMRGNHGGLTLEELLVPMLVYEL
ncbi:MAG: alkaline phosphatase family protein [Thermoprotei archaeon]